MVNLLRVAKAGALGEQPTDERAILITDEVPEYATSQDYAAFYEAQAQGLAQALRDSLPGGTLSRLTALLLLQQAGYLRVPLPNPEA